MRTANCRMGVLSMSVWLVGACAVSVYPADLFSGSSLGLGYQIGAAAAAAAAASPWRQLYTAASPAAEHRYRHSPLQSTITPHHVHHQPQPLWSPTSAFTHPTAAAAAGFNEGATASTIYYIHCLTLYRARKCPHY